MCMRAENPIHSKRYRLIDRTEGFGPSDCGLSPPAATIACILIGRNLGSEPSSLRSRRSELTKYVVKRNL